MTVGIVGPGLIGGSLAKAYQRALLAEGRLRRREVDGP